MRVCYPVLSFDVENKMRSELTFEDVRGVENKHTHNTQINLNKQKLGEP